MNYWLVKSEPEEYSWQQLLKEGSAIWDGVRNFQARNNLRRMKRGDPVLYYHSGERSEVVGIAKVLKESCQDPADKTGDWVVVELAPVNDLLNPVPLKRIKSDIRFRNTALVRQSRLSVLPLKKSEFNWIVRWGENG